MALACFKLPWFSPSAIAGDGLRRSYTSLRSSSSSSLCLANIRRSRRNFMVNASPELNSASTAVIFEPFEEIMKNVLTVACDSQVSLARHNYQDEFEAATNKQINVEYNVSYAYHSMFAYFDRDNIALKGFVKFFEELSEEEREHAEKLGKYQNDRGGRAVLHPTKNPPSDFEHAEKGDAFYGMSLEKLTNEKLLNVYSVADHNNDPEFAHFIQSESL